MRVRTGKCNAKCKYAVQLGVLYPIPAGSSTVVRAQLPPGHVPGANAARRTANFPFGLKLGGFRLTFISSLCNYYGTHHTIILPITYYHISLLQGSRSNARTELSN